MPNSMLSHDHTIRDKAETYLIFGNKLFFQEPERERNRDALSGKRKTFFLSKLFCCFIHPLAFLSKLNWVFFARFEIFMSNLFERLLCCFLFVSFSCSFYF